jgi:hypothetical protein
MKYYIHAQCTYNIIYNILLWRRGRLVCVLRLSVPIKDITEISMWSTFDRGQSTVNIVMRIPPNNITSRHRGLSVHLNTDSAHKYIIVYAV